MSDDPHPLSDMPLGYKGYISALDNPPLDDQLRQTLLERGFLTGTFIEVTHLGAIRRDPIAVKINSEIIALRRDEACIILVSQKPAA